jgi:hypothetical protein
MQFGEHPSVLLMFFCKSSLFFFFKEKYSVILVKALRSLKYKRNVCRFVVKKTFLMTFREDHLNLPRRFIIS